MILWYNYLKLNIMNINFAAVFLCSSDFSLFDPENIVLLCFFCLITARGTGMKKFLLDILPFYGNRTMRRELSSGYSA